MARVAPAPGIAVEETIRTRVVPDEKLEERDDRDFWEFQASLNPEQWKRYLVYVYRRQGDRLGAYVGKYASAISEDSIAENHGGGQYRIFMKTVAGEIIKRAELEIEGAPKISSTAPASTLAPANASNGDARSLDRLCDLLERVIMRNDSTAVQGEALKAALQLQSEGFRSVVTNVRDVTNPPNQSTAPDPMRDVMQQFMTAAIAKMLNPTSPIEEFSKMLAAVKSLGLDGGAKASVGAELVRTVGGAIPQIMDGIKSYTYAVGKQAELEILRITHGMRNPPAPSAQAVAPPQPGPAAVQPPAPPAAPQEPQQVMTFEDVERRIAGFMMDTKLTATEAAGSILDFVEDISPNQLYPYICKLSEVDLTAFINSRPILSQVPKDPRFSEVVKKIVELSNPAPADSPNTSPQSPA